MKFRGFVGFAAGALLLAASPALAVTQKASDAPKIKVSIVGALTTPSQLVLDVSLPGKTYTKLVPYKAPDGKTYYKVVMPGLTTSFDPTKSVTAGLGRPGIPALSIPFAIPEAASAAGGPSAGYASVSTQILSATFKDTKVGKDIFPASTQPLDGTVSQTSIGLGRYLAHCLTDPDGKLHCWGDDTQAPTGAPINSLNAWIDAHPQLPGGIGPFANAIWRKVAVGMTNGYKANACLVGDLVPNPTTATAPMNSLFCIGDTSTLSYTALGVGGPSSGDAAGGTGSGASVIDIKDIQSTSGYADGSEYCLLKNYGSTYLPAMVRGNGEIKCFGRGGTSDWASPAMTDPVTGAATHYTQLSVGWNHACALVVSGRVRCFGFTWDQSSATLPSGLPPLKKVAAGNIVDCGIVASNNTLTCWGITRIGESALIVAPLPAEVVGQPVKDISIGDDGACVVKNNGSVVCFNFDYYGMNGYSEIEQMPPSVAAGPWESVKVAGGTPYEVACATSAAQKVSCWGNNFRNAASPPELANKPFVWNDPIFDDFIPAKLYSDMPESLVRPFVKVPESYTAPEPVPAGTVTKSGAPITGEQTLFKANTVKNDQGDPVRLRGLGLGQLYLYGGQYTAATKKLRVFSKVRVKITFANPKINSRGTADYGLDTVDTPWNQSFKKIYGNVLVNASIALGNLTPSPVLRKSHTRAVNAGSARCGEEMLVVTDPAFAAQADQFRLAKNRQGILTRVAQVGDSGVGSTATSIRDFVQGEFTKTDSGTGSPCITPSYLTLLGDVSRVPTFAGDVNSPDTPSDIDYSLPARGTYVPDLAVGRLPASDISEARTMTSKILAYESSAPSSSDAFYRNLTVTSFFQNSDPGKNQDQRGFIRSSEQLIAALSRTGSGLPAKTAERLYSTSNPTGATKLAKDDLGRAFPALIQKTQRQAPWNSGTQTSVVNSVRSGRFLVISRDHGGFDRIFNPAYGSFVPAGGTASAVNQMSNGSALPVAWLIACLSGRYDDPGNSSFAEDMLRHSGGGMAGVLASSRESPSEVNNSLMLALADAVWPSVLPTGNRLPIYRMGDAINAAKLQVLMSGGPSASIDINNEMRLYNWFGDPSMQLWTSKPAALSTAISGFPAVTSDGVSIRFTTAAANGATAILLNADGEPIGRGTVATQAVSIAAGNGIAADGQLTVVLVKDQSLPTSLTLRS